MKACIACKHFQLDEARWYSSGTGSDPASMNCGKSHFYAESVDGELPALLLSKAMDCADFELSKLAISRGWKP